jgi:glycosyltransferase involved in cell wall biosynthesis
VGFFYSCIVGNGIARFMVVTGEYFIKKGYNVYFITKPPHPKDFQYNEKIKRIYAYNNITLLKEVLKSGIIDILIVNNVFSQGNIKFYKSYGIKVIGIYHGVFISPMFNNMTGIYRSWKYTELFDAYVQIGIDDYYFFKSFGFKKNIFIPNLYTFEPSETPNANLTSHNLMMLGRLADKKKGVIYAIKAMELIVKEVPDAQLYLVSSDSSFNEFKNLTQKMNLTNNVVFTPFTCNISDYLLNASIFFFPSITEAFPMALNEAKAYGLPCLTFDISYSVPYQSGVVKVDMFDHEALAREAIKLLKDYDYRVRIGREAKLSLNKFNNDDTTNMWSRLFNALMAGGDEYQKLRKEIESKYYNEELAEKHMEKQLNNLKRYNKFFRCHSLKNLTNIDYINNIEPCKNVELLRRN